MFLVAFIFDYSKDELQRNRGEFFSGFLFAVCIMLIINYFVLDFLFAFYGKKQIRLISTILPDEVISDGSSALSFSDLGERVSELQHRNATEIDTMKVLEKYRKEYIGNVSHEMKTPLFSIQGYVETLIDGGIDNLDIRDKYLSRIENSVERLINIVQDLDQIIQYESGEIILQEINFDIVQLAREVLDLLDFDAEKRGARLVLDGPKFPLLVHADQQKISQVLINLVSNAIHYSNRENAVITVRTTESGDKVVVVVHDNGMGIKQEALPRIFERFYRVESSRSRRQGGSGLGLAIVKHILEAHRQSITAESVYLEGTTFTFTLDKAVKSV